MAVDSRSGTHVPPYPHRRRARRRRDARCATRRAGTVARLTRGTRSRSEPNDPRSRRSHRGSARARAASIGIAGSHAHARHHQPAIGRHGANDVRLGRHVGARWSGPDDHAHGGRDPNHPLSRKTFAPGAGERTRGGCQRGLARRGSASGSARCEGGLVRACLHRSRARDRGAEPRGARGPHRDHRVPVRRGAGGSAGCIEGARRGRSARRCGGRPERAARGHERTAECAAEPAE